MATQGWHRKAARLAVVAAVLSVSATLPALDRDMFVTGERIEAEHSAAACFYVHDHVLCIQWAGSRWLRAANRPDVVPTLEVTEAEWTDPHAAPAAAARFGVRSRAPPII